MADTPRKEARTPKSGNKGGKKMAGGTAKPAATPKTTGGGAAKK